MNDTTPEPIPVEQIERALKFQVQQAAERIGDPDQSSSLGPEVSLREREIYARGVRTAVEALAERFEVSIAALYLNQLEGALGEFAQRTTPGARPFHSRALNDLVNEIRVMRIRMIDDYEGLDYPRYREWDKRFRKIERQEKLDRAADELHWRECVTVSRELTAIWSLNHQLVSDRGWFEEYNKRSDRAKTIGQQFVPQSTVPILA